LLKDNILAYNIGYHALEILVGMHCHFFFSVRLNQGYFQLSGKLKHDLKEDEIICNVGGTESGDLAALRS
jgi:hypothetical protein